MAPADLAARLLAVADDVLRIQGISSVRPHIFMEQKSEVAKRIRDLAAEVTPKPVMIVRDVATPARFQLGRVEVRRGVSVVVAMRGRRRAA